MYNNYIPQGYMQPQYNNPYQDRLNAIQSNFTPRQEIIRVNGENGAKAYNMPPNSSILLLDETAPIIWLKSTDGAGYPSLAPYTIAPYQVEQPVDAKSLEQRIERLEQILNEKSDVTDVKSKHNKSSNATDEQQPYGNVK